MTVNRRCYFNEVVYEEISQLLVEEAGNGEGKTWSYFVLYNKEVNLYFSWHSYIFLVPFLKIYLL